MKSVAKWLEQHKSEAVAQIVQRVYEELPDYRTRPVEQLAAGVGSAYDQWCDTVLRNDLMRHAREAEAAILEAIARGTDPNQLARVPAVISAVVLAMLAQAGPTVDPAEQALFQRRADHMTASILGIGSLRIARVVLQKGGGESIVPRTDAEEPPGS